VKVDRQVLAIARQHNVKTIITDDDDMIAEASRVGIEAIRPIEIPLKSKQNKLDFDSTSDSGEASSAANLNIEPPSDGK
jgi:hypothetical protein